MRAARATAPPYRVHRGGDRPWVHVYGGDGFPEAWLNDYIQFVAWQDHPPRHVAHEAWELIQAATWLAANGRTWPAGDLGVWTAYGLALTGPPRTARRGWRSTRRWRRCTGPMRFGMGGGRCPGNRSPAARPTAAAGWRPCCPRRTNAPVRTARSGSTPLRACPCRPRRGHSAQQRPDAGPRQVWVR